MAVTETTKVGSGEIIKSGTINEMIDNITDLQSQVSYNYNSNEAEHTKVKEEITAQFQSELAEIKQRLNALEAKE